MQNKLKQFTNWLKSHGAKHEKLEFTTEGIEEGCGARTTRDIEQEEDLFEIPLNLLITRQLVDTSSELSNVVQFIHSLSSNNNLSNNNLSNNNISNNNISNTNLKKDVGGGSGIDWMPMYLFMVIEKSKGESSKWAPYW